MVKEIKGLMFIRHIGNKSLLIAVIDNPKTLQGEAQHLFKGTVNNDILRLQTTGDVIDIKDLARGNTPDGLLAEPIWRT